MRLRIVILAVVAIGFALMVSQTAAQQPAGTAKTNLTVGEVASWCRPNPCSTERMSEFGEGGTTSVSLRFGPELRFEIPQLVQADFTRADGASFSVWGRAEFSAVVGTFRKVALPPTPVPTATVRPPIRSWLLQIDQKVPLLACPRSADEAVRLGGSRQYWNQYYIEDPTTKARIPFHKYDGPEEVWLLTPTGSIVEYKDQKEANAGIWIRTATASVYCTA